MFTVLARVKLSFTDTVIRFEHLPKDTLTGIGLEIHIRRYLVHVDLHSQPTVLHKMCFSELHR